jgi:hypothetical protein
MSTLTNIIANLESGGSTNEGAAAGGYVNYRYQQFPGFVSQYGFGAPGVENYAGQMLAAKPNATLGDFYSGYVMNTGDPANPPGLAALANPSSYTNNAAIIAGARGAYGNLTSKYDPSTPLSSLLGGASGGAVGVGSGGFGDTSGEPNAPNDCGYINDSMFSGGLGSSTSSQGGGYDPTAGAGTDGIGSAGVPDSSLSPSATPYSTSSQGGGYSGAGTAASGGSSGNEGQARFPVKPARRACLMRQRRPARPARRQPELWLQAQIDTASNLFTRGLLMLLGVVLILVALIVIGMHGAGKTVAYASDNMGTG